MVVQLINNLESIYPQSPAKKLERECKEVEYFNFDSEN